MIIKRDVFFGLLAGLIGLTLLFVVSSVFCGCASQTPREDSNHYVAQVQNYSCPSCGYRIDMNNVNKNIRMENVCSSCGKLFFYAPIAEPDKTGNYQSGYGKYGPRTHGPTSVYQSDTGYQRLYSGGYSFKENSYGFTESYWRFRDSKVKSFRVIPHWRTTRYHYP